MIPRNNKNYTSFFLLSLDFEDELRVFLFVSVTILGTSEVFLSLYCFYFLTLRTLP